MSEELFKAALTQGDLAKALFYARLHIKKGGAPWPEYRELEACFMALEEIRELFDRRSLLSYLQRLEHIEKKVRTQGFDAIFGNIGPFSEPSFIAAKKKYEWAKQILGGGKSVSDVESALEQLKTEAEWGAELWMPILDLRRKQGELVLTSRLNDLSDLEAKARSAWTRGTVGPELNALEDALKKAQEEVKEARERFTNIQEALKEKEAHSSKGWGAAQIRGQEHFERLLDTTTKEIENKEYLAREIAVYQLLGCFDAAQKNLMACVKAFDDRKHDAASISAAAKSILGAVETLQPTMTSIDTLRDKPLPAPDPRTTAAIERYRNHIDELKRTILDNYNENKLRKFWKFRKEALQLCKAARYQSAEGKISDAIGCLGRTHLKRTLDIETEIAWALQRLAIFNRKPGEETIHDAPDSYIIKINQVKTAFENKVPAVEARRKLDDLNNYVNHIIKEFNNPANMATTLGETDVLSPFDETRTREIKKTIADLESVYNIFYGGSYWQRFVFFLRSITRK